MVGFVCFDEGNRKTVAILKEENTLATVSSSCYKVDNSTTADAIKIIELNQHAVFKYTINGQIRFIKVQIRPTFSNIWILSEPGQCGCVRLVSCDCVLCVLANDGATRCSTRD